MVGDDVQGELILGRLQADLDVARGDLEVAETKCEVLKDLLKFYETALHNPIGAYQRANREEFEKLVVATGGTGDIDPVWQRTLAALKARAESAGDVEALKKVFGIFEQAIRDPGPWYAYQRQAQALVSGVHGAIEAVIGAARDAAFYRAALHNPAGALIAAADRGGDDLLAVQRLASVPSVLQESAAALRAETERAEKAERGLAFVRSLLDSAIDGALR